MAQEDFKIKLDPPNTWRSTNTIEQFKQTDAGGGAVVLKKKKMVIDRWIVNNIIFFFPHRLIN